MLLNVVKLHSVAFKLKAHQECEFCGIQGFLKNSNLQLRVFYVFYKLSDLNMFLYGFKIIELYDNESLISVSGISYNSDTVLSIF